MNLPANSSPLTLLRAQLPVCSASPLWWRFLQNLRQVYDERQRWPYLGNALKYFLAAQVAMFGVFHPDKKQNIVWLASYVGATLYQCWWDVYMDWNLIDDTRCLRSKRLYQSRAFYWIIAWVNLALRFCWILSFLPVQYLNYSGVLTGSLVGSTANQILAPMIACAEIVRRTLWGFLRFEWEAIKTSEAGIMNLEQEMIFLEENDPDAGVGSVELQPMMIRVSGENGSATTRMGEIAGRRNVPRYFFLSDMSSMDTIQVIGELGVYAAIFCLFCLVMAAHRGTY